MNTETDIVSLSEINAVAPYKVFYLFEKREVLHFSTNKGKRPIFRLDVDLI